MIPYNNLFNKFDEIADDLIESINATSMTLYFRPLYPSNTVGSVDNDIVGIYGEQQPLINESGSENKQGDNFNFADGPNEIIKVRAYWDKQDFDKIRYELKIDIKRRMCKVITYTTHMPALENASYATINGISTIICKPPVPYGFRKRYCVSYWVENV